MDLKQELKLLREINKRIFINQLKDAWRDQKKRVLIIILILYLSAFPVMFVLTSPGDDTEADSEEDSEPGLSQNDIELIYLIYISMLSYLSFIGGITALKLFKDKSEFFLPKPINKRSIILYKILSGFIFFIIATFIGYFISILILKGVEFETFFDFIKPYYGGLTLTIILFCLFPLIINIFYKVPDTKLNKAIKNIFKSILVISIIEIFYLIFYPFFSLSESEFNFITFGLSIPPLNVFLLIPFSSYYICVGDVSDPYFWLAFIGNTIFFIFIVHSALKFDYIIYEDFFTQQPSTMGPGREVQAPSKWWRKGFLKDIYLDYPIIKKGESALLEVNLLSNFRFSYQMSFMFFVVLLIMSLFFTPIMDKMGNFVLIMGLGFLILVSLMMPNMESINFKYETFKTLPISGSKLIYILVLGTAFGIMIPFYGLFIFFIVTGSIIDLEYILIFLIMSGTLSFGIITFSHCGYFLLANDDDLSRTDQSNPSISAGVGGALFGMIFIFFNLAMHTLISSLIDSGWKFLIIIILDIILIKFYMYLFKIEYDKTSLKKKRTGLRMAISFIIAFFLGFISLYSPIYGSIFNSGYSYEPDSEDVEILNYTIIENQHIAFDDYFYIESGEVFIIINSTIQFNCTKDNIFGLYLARSGYLEIENSLILSQNKTIGFRFELFGSTYINNTIFKNIGSKEYDGGYNHGILIKNNNVFITNSFIDNVTFNGITISNASPMIENTYINNCGHYGIRFVNSTAIIINCTIKNSGWEGMYIDRSSPTILDCSFIDNKGYGIMISDSTPYLDNNTFENNLKGDIKYI